MLKPRLIACLPMKNNIVVQSIGFQKYLPVGDPAIAIEFLNQWGIDEIILLDIDATREKRGPNFELVKRISRKCFVPLTVGGGIRTLEDIRKLIRYGADKVSLNSAAVENPELVSRAAAVFGNQCIIVSLDVGRGSTGKQEVFIRGGTTATGVDPREMALRMEHGGAGEIFLTSMERDGTGQGYDLELIQRVSDGVNVPVIACGGVGHPQHFIDGFLLGKATACAAGNFFHFTEHSPITTKSFLLQKGINIRLDTNAHYNDSNFDMQGRIAKKDDSYLEKIRFEYFPQEVI